MNRDFVFLSDLTLHVVEPDLVFAAYTCPRRGDDARPGLDSVGCVDAAGGGVRTLGMALLIDVVVGKPSRVSWWPR